MNRRARSLVTGFYYPKIVSEELAKLKFSSNLWITKTELEMSGLVLQRRYDGRHFFSKVAKGEKRFYNLDQTTYQKLNQNLIGQVVAKSLLSTEALPAAHSRELIKKMEEYEKNQWITDEEIKLLNLRLKKNAFSVSLEDVASGNSSHKKIVYYNVAEIVDQEIAGRLNKLFPISASTGRFYAMPHALGILKQAIEREYDSPFWLTKTLAEQLNVEICKDSEPFVVSFEDSSKKLNLYNSEQTSSSKTVIAHGIEQSA